MFILFDISWERFVGVFKTTASIYDGSFLQK